MPKTLDLFSKSLAALFSHQQTPADRLPEHECAPVRAATDKLIRLQGYQDWLLFI